jgi:hypothetical protein
LRQQDRNIVRSQVFDQIVKVLGRKDGVANGVEEENPDAFEAERPLGAFHHDPGSRAERSFAIEPHSPSSDCGDRQNQDDHPSE